VIEMPKFADLALLFFTITNGLRIFAYVPQLIRVVRDREGAVAISYLTWSMFAVANLSTAIYAVSALHDTTVAIIFAGNTVFCLAIVVATAGRRRLRRGVLRRNHEPVLPAMLTLHHLGD
jgi:uncharacterized protein with PQ loop repeat